MSNVWREYGAIAVLLVVAIGGYLFLSRSEEDLMARALETVSDHLLALVPEQDRDRTLASLEEFERRAAEGEVPPEQIEWLAASVLNLSSSGSSLASEEAEMMVSLALNDSPLLPEPAVSRQAPPRPPSTPVQKSRKKDLLESAGRVSEMFNVLTEVKGWSGQDSTFRDAPPVRFYSDRGLRAVVDERLRGEVERAERFDRARQESLVAWQSRLAESVEAEAERKAVMAQELGQLWAAVKDSMIQEAAQLEKLATMRSLESRGFMFGPEMESLAVDLEGQLKSRIGGGAFSLSVGQDGQLRLESRGTGTSGRTSTASRANAQSSN
ncbi:MAG: hypothetical protein JJ896_03775 [Rhodothermales bacterium]|nr:hypothetical protein [Rhodothermales bacterium]MBO6778754.1 hypothetical protein [Rhodothermales bacterium]